MEVKSRIDEELESQIRACPLIPNEAKEEFIAKTKSFFTESQKVKLLAMIQDKPVILFRYYQEAKTFLDLKTPDSLTFSQT